MSNKYDTPLVSLQNPPGTPMKRGNPATVELEEIMFPAIINFRANPEQDGLLKVAGQALGLPLPLVPNTTSISDTHIAYWLSPDEWLVRSAASNPNGGAALQQQMEAALAGQFFATTDQSSAYSVMQLRGPKARAVLAKGCPLDLHPSAIGPGQCAQSHYFRASVLLRPLDEANDTWEIIVRRSFADSTARVLLDAMAEYQ